MIFLLLNLGVSILQSDYSIIPPLYNTEIGEIGNWTIRGTATNLKHSVRLTTTIPGSFGSLCQRVPTTFKEWSMELELKAQGAENNPGHGIWFFYTNEVCPEFAFKFSGFAFWINTSSTDSEGYSSIYFLKGNGTEVLLSSLEPVGKIKARGNKRPLRIIIARRFGRLTIDSASDIIFNRVVDEDVTLTPDYGYISISALTTSRVDNNDVVSVRMYNMSSVDHPDLGLDFSTMNRKYIENNVKDRRQRKRIRHAEMPTMVSYVNEANNNEKSLSANDKPNVRDSMKILAEVCERAIQTIDVTSLEKFLSDRVDNIVNQASSKIELAARKYQEVQIDIDALWSSLKVKMIDIAMEEKEGLRALQTEIMTYAKTLNLSMENPQIVKWRLKYAASRIRDNKVTQFLLLISIFEFVGYIIFFFYKRQATGNFKKHD